MCLYFLDLLQHEHFRREVVNAQCCKFIDDQAILLWQHYTRRRTKTLEQQHFLLQNLKENPQANNNAATTGQNTNTTSSITTTASNANPINSTSNSTNPSNANNYSDENLGGSGVAASLFDSMNDNLANTPDNNSGTVPQNSNLASAAFDGNDISNNEIADDNNSNHMEVDSNNEDANINNEMGEGNNDNNSNMMHVDNDNSEVNAEEDKLAEEPESLIADNGGNPNSGSNNDDLESQENPNENHDSNNGSNTDINSGGSDNKDIEMDCISDLKTPSNPKTPASQKQQSKEM